MIVLAIFNFEGFWKITISMKWLLLEIFFNQIKKLKFLKNNKKNSLDIPPTKHALTALTEMALFVTARAKWQCTLIGDVG